MKTIKLSKNDKIELVETSKLLKAKGLTLEERNELKTTLFRMNQIDLAQSPGYRDLVPEKVTEILEIMKKEGLLDQNDFLTERFFDLVDNNSKYLFGEKKPQKDILDKIIDKFENNHSIQNLVIVAVGSKINRLYLHYISSSRVESYLDLPSIDYVATYFDKEIRGNIRDIMSDLANYFCFLDIYINQKFYVFGKARNDYAASVFLSFNIFVLARKAPVPLSHIILGLINGYIKESIQL